MNCVVQNSSSSIKRHLFDPYVIFSKADKRSKNWLEKSFVFQWSKIYISQRQPDPIKIVGQDSFFKKQVFWTWLRPMETQHAQSLGDTTKHTPPLSNSKRSSIKSFHKQWKQFLNRRTDAHRRKMFGTIIRKPVNQKRGFGHINIRKYGLKTETDDDKSLVNDEYTHHIHHHIH